MTQIYRKRLTTAALLALLFFAHIRCGGDNISDPGGNEVTAGKITNLSAADTGNSGNGQDLQVAFSKAADESGVKEYRVIVIKSEDLSGFTLETANALTSDNYTAIAKTGVDLSSTLPANAKDKDGETITEETAYRVFVLSVADGTVASVNALSAASQIITLSSTAVAAANLDVADIENSGDASDLSISFDAAAQEDKISEYRVMLTLSERAGAFNLAAADAVTLGNYAPVAKTGKAIQHRFPPELKDVDGAPITGDAKYRVFVLSVADGVIAIRNALSAPSGEFRLETTNLVHTITGEIPAGSGGMCVDADGNVYTADFGVSLGGTPGDKVWKITPDGDVSVFAAGFNGASGNAINSKGEFFQSNIAGNSISRVSTDGAVSTFVTQGIVNPVGLIFDREDNLYVANCGNNTIRKVTPEGVSTPYASSVLFNCPNGVAIDTLGNLYVANFGNGSVIKVDTNRVVTLFASITGGNNGHITYANDEFYVVGRSANQIYRVALDGTVSLLAGTGQRGRRDDAALNATFSLPNDLAADPTGKFLYINDVVPHNTPNSLISPTVIRRITLIDRP